MRRRTRKAKATDPILAQFGAAGKGGVPMPNIPQMASVWSDLGAGVGPLDEGLRRDDRRAFLQGRGPQSIADKIG